MTDYVQTVTGKKTRETLGIVDAHTHLWIETPRSNCVKEPNHLLNEFSLVEKELKKFKNCKIVVVSNGNATAIDCQPWGSGRNGNKLNKLSESSKVNIIAVTGFHSRDYYNFNCPIWTMTRKEAVHFFINELKIGLKETFGVRTYCSNLENNRINIKAGAIKMSYVGKLEVQYKILTEAAVEASLLTGAPLIVHTEQGLGIEKLVAFFQSRGIPFSKIMLCHMDKKPDFELHKYLAGESFYLEYDTFLRSKYEPNFKVWPLIIQMINAGYSKAIMIGSDLASNLSWKIMQRLGLCGFFVVFTEKLLALDIDIKDIKKIVSLNAQNFLFGN